MPQLPATNLITRTIKSNPNSSELIFRLAAKNEPELKMRAIS